LTHPFPKKIFPQFLNPMNFVPVHQIRLRQNNRQGSSKVFQPEKSFQIDRQNISPDIDEQKNPLKTGHFFYQKSRQRTRFLSGFLISFHITIAWKINKISPLVERIQICQSGLSGSSADFSKVMPVGKLVDQGGFSDIGPANKSDDSFFFKKRKLLRRSQGANKHGG